MQVSHMLRALVLGTVLAGTGGCVEPEPEPLRVGLLVWPPYELAVLAREKGWLPESNVRLLEYQSPAELSRAFRNGLLDSVFLTSHLSLRLADQGVAHRMVYVIDFSRGGDALVTKPSIGSLSELRGKTIGVEPSALGAYVFHRMLDKAGLERDDVEVVPLDVPEQVPLWTQEWIDAIVCYEPQRSQLIQQGGEVLFDSRAMPREIADVILVREALFDDAAQVRHVQLLVQAMDRALGYYRQSPDEAVAIMARRHPLSPEAFRLALDGAELLDAEANRQLLGGRRPELQPALEKQARLLKKVGLLRGEPDYDRMLDGQFVCRECLP